jgi:hypothetical protein
MGERVMLHSRPMFIDDEQASLCADVVDNTLMLTAINFRQAEVQVRVDLATARRLGEWLIERANQAGEK